MSISVQSILNLASEARQRHELILFIARPAEGPAQSPH